MPLIHLNTQIKAPIQIVFDLSRSIDFHQESASETGEIAIAGRTSGLIELGETVTWEAVHFGIKQNLTTKITAMNAPHSFTDEMLKGVFKSIKHDHLFTEVNGVTTMVDNFYFESPLGIFGKLFNAFILKNHMKRFLEIRNAAIKREAESQSSKN
jgi:ligand-binding SRPBCC domain-containing protein